MSTYYMPVVIDGSLPVRRPYGILSVADLINESSDRWLNGGTVESYPPGAPRLWDPACREGPASPEKDEGDPIPNTSFGSVTTYFPITCTAKDIGNPDTFANRARLVLGVKTQFAIERQLVSGEGLATNRYFADIDDTDILAGGSAVSSDEGLALLEDALVLDDGLGVIHAPPSIVSAWSFSKIERGSRLETVNGTPVVSGAGYINAVPDHDDHDDPVADTDRQWAWGTGPIQLRLTEVEGIPDDIAEAMTVYGDDANKVTFLAERHFLASWDTQVQVAVLIDRSL